MPFPYDFPITFPDRYLIEVTWGSSIYDDITADVKTVHFSRGKSDELGKAEVGQLSITLKNADAKYTPNAGGVISAYLLPKKPISIIYCDGATDYPLFYGFIEEIIPHPHWAEQDCIITASDGLDFLSRHDLDTILYKDTLTGAIHSAILDSAGWSATMRTLDAGQNTIPYWYSSGVKARFAQEEIDDSELGFSYVDGSGYFRFEDRTHRPLHVTASATFDNTMANITYNLNAKRIYNEITATVTPWAIQAEAELWRLKETPSIPTGETYTWWGESSYSGTSVFVDAWVTPVAGAGNDYTANSAVGGGGDDETGNITITTTKFAKTIKLAIKNNALHTVYITLLKARGTWYDDQTKVTRKATDTTSQTTYQKRTLAVDAKYMTTATTAQDFCDFALARYKDPQPEVTISLVNKNATLLANILSLEISDRIAVVNDKLNLSQDFYIDYMEHDISLSGLLHTVSYKLVPGTNEDMWVWGVSIWGSTTKWGF